MSISEKQRHQLYARCQDLMGEEEASTLMSLLPPVGWADVATKGDLGVLRRGLDAVADRLDIKFDHLGGRIDQLDGRIDQLDGRIDRLDGRLSNLEHANVEFRERFVHIDDRFDACATTADLHKMEARLQRTFVTWILAAHAAVIAAMSGFFVVFR